MSVFGISWQSRQFLTTSDLHNFSYITAKDLKCLAFVYQHMNFQKLVYNIVYWQLFSYGAISKMKEILL